MAVGDKFSRKDSILTAFGITFGSGGSCTGEVSYDDVAEAFISKCAGSQTTGTIAGQRTITAVINGFVKNNDVALLNALEPQQTAADWVDYPAGNTATYIKITSTKATITGRAISGPIDGLCTFTINVSLDDMTIAAAT